MKNLALFLLMLAVIAFAAPSPCAAEEGHAEKKEEKKEEKKDEHKKGGGEEEKKAPADVSGGRFVGDPVFVHLSPMILPIITDKGASQIVTLAITLEVTDFDSADLVHTKMPVVKDALMRALYGGLGDGSLRNGQLIDVTRVKSKATKALGDAIGAEHIKNVLIEAVAQRRL